ncbi:peroxisomal membrane anchor protein conserved region-domain-containing protein [Obelidium mucronatum]|nr:peroxisomal membrane anchor protein conserved region-domain-containing protein [Obelidium mucronatum]
MSNQQPPLPTTPITTATAAPPSNSTIRPESIALAVKFLSDPKVQSAPLNKRIAFLESKGLTSDEINEAIKRAAAGSDVAPDLPPRPVYPYPQQQQQQQGYQRDWRDYSLGLIGLLGFGYGVYHLAQTYIVPNISWPGSAQHKEEQERLETQISSISTALELATKTIQEQTQKLQIVLDTSVAEQERNAEDVRLMRDELESLKDLLPGMMKPNPGEPSIADLQSEIKSLKNLLLNRKAFPPIPTSSPIPPPLAYQSSTIPAWQLATPSNSSSSTSYSAVAARSASPEKRSPSPQPRTTSPSVKGFTVQGQSDWRK